jgi:5-methylthioribose kinase
MISEEQIYTIIADQLHDFTPISDLIPLDGGNLNHVWRLEGNPQNLIIKWAPPYIAANPEISLNSDRIHFEAKALQLFSKGKKLAPIATTDVCPPKLYHYSPGHSFIIMEDVGTLPSITEWYRNTDNSNIGEELGQFIGQLHKNTQGRQKLGQHFHNLDIQQTRQQLQYNPAADYIKKTGVTNVDFNLIASNTKTLGQQLLKPGKCLTMGDLWPRSVLVDKDQIRLIDWEFTHYGRPLQDTGHFAAHCWMQGHATGEDVWAKALWNHFWNGYRAALGNSFDQLFDEQERDGMATHIGTEILVRAAGPFKQGYVYADYKPDTTLIKEATQKAVTLITSPHFSELW